MLAERPMRFVRRSRVWVWSEFGVKDLRCSVGRRNRVQGVYGRGESGSGANKDAVVLNQAHIKAR